MSFLKSTLLIALTGFSTLSLAESPKDDFINAYSKLEIKTPIDQSNTSTQTLPEDLVQSLCSESRVRAKILHVKNDHIEVDKNNLYFYLNSDICVQNVFELKMSYSVHSLCIRDKYILMDFTFEYRKP